MKSKEFFAKLKSDGKISKTEYDTFLETVPEFEIPDKGVVDVFEESFLTPDRAAVDKRVHSKLKREFLDPLDNDQKKILALIDQHDKFKSSEIDKMQSTYDKSAAITAYLPELLTKIKGTPVTDEDTKKELAKQKETVQELLGKIEGINKENSTKEKHWEKQSEEKINSFRMNMELEKLANSFKFGKAFQDDAVRKDITKVKLDKLLASHKLQLVEKDGQISISVLDGEGKPRFNGNSAVTINQLLEEEFKPYIKASNVNDEDDSDNTDNSKDQATKRFKVSDDKQTNFRQGARTTVFQKS
jgi:hypothetical protein